MTPPTKSWKATERRVARLFGMERNPLSGGASGHGTRSDAIPTDEPAVEPPLPTALVYIETKHSGGGKAAPANVLKLFADTRRKAREERRIPILVHYRSGHPGSETATIRLAHLLSILRAISGTSTIEEIANDLVRST